MSNARLDDERQPLLENADAGDARVDGEQDNKQSWLDWAAEHKLNIILATLVAMFVAFLVTTLVTRLPNDKQTVLVPSADICNASGCVLAASTLLRSISPRHKELDPCDDFRTYACEGFDSIHDIREDLTSVGSLQLMSEEGQVVLKRILESPAPPHTSLFWTASSPDVDIFTKMQDGYNACLNETQLRSVGSKPLIDLLYRLDDVLKADKLTGAVQFLMSFGVGSPISLYVGADDKDPDTNVVALTPPFSFGLPSKQYYNRTELIESYKDTIASVLGGLMKEARGHPRSATDTDVFAPFRMPGTTDVLNKKIIDDLVDFESAMAAASPDPEDLSDITKVYNPRTLDEADSYNPAISVRTIIKRFTDGAEPSKIIVASPKYLKSLAKILDSQNDDVLQTYLVWKLVQSYGTVVESNSVEGLRQFNNKLLGKEPGAKPERWRICVGVVNSDLPWILSRFYVERAFSKDAKNLGDEIILDIKDQFIEKLKQSKWMTKSVRHLAINKVNLIRQKIGYPTKSPDITNAEELDEYYTNVTIRADTLFENRLSSTQNDIERQWAQLGQPVDKDEWGMSAPTVNAYYNPPGNEIVFPAGIMQAPVFYDPSVPKYLSYGAFGAVAGHELSHAFDSTGSNYDPNGNYTDWWDEPTLKAFKEKTNCFVEQYENYSIPTKDGPIPVNGRLTLGENIADAGGLSAAFQSWRGHDQEDPDLLLPGLTDFTKEQVFFLAYGLTWCGKSREEEAVRRLYTDPHSPNQFRIRGTTANSREFRKAFNCPVKEPNCELW